MEFASGGGEIRTLDLADGSRITLDAATLLQTAYSTDERRIVPLRGRARFAVAEAATWLDVRLGDAAAAPPREAGFGAELAGAEHRRRQWLLAQGLAEDRDGTFCIAPGTLAQLRRRELLRVAQGLSGELGLPFGEAAAGERIEGVCRRRIDGMSGRFALIERAHDFTLVPWREVLERHVGKEVSGVVRGGGISWTIGRARAGPSIG
jgi:ferric-dicitrate binding protein FerR (iron transport regulator)